MVQENPIDKQEWLYEITPKGKLIDFNFKEIWRYRDLLMLFVRRDIVAQYKQTILGPLWYLIQPLFTGVIFTLVFNNIASIGTGSAPPFLFNLAGITFWNYFKQCINSSTNTFSANAGLFGKVYFPRLIVPLSQSISALFKLGIQLFIFGCFYIYFHFTEGGFGIRLELFLFPLLIIILVLTAIGGGMILSALTTKYRDFKILIGFALQLLMYLSAVMYPISEVYKSERFTSYTWIVTYNPVAIIIESFRYTVFGTGMFDIWKLVYCLILSVSLFLIGMIVFNRTERTFIDTI